MSHRKERLCVVMPVYNEEEAIAPVLLKWDSMLKSLNIDYEIRPYNDGSKDGSLAVMQKVAAESDRIKVRNKPNGGHGNTILTGYREALADGFDWIFQIDSDDEMGPEKFGELWAKRTEFDFLVGRRQGRKQATSRKIISLISRLCVRFFYGRSVWDVNTPYRLMRISAFAPFFKKLPLNTFAPNVILSGLAARYGLRCLEISVPQHDRTTGEVSIKKWKLFKAAARSLLQTIWFAAPDFSVNKLEITVFILCYTVAVLGFSCSPIINHPLTDSSVFIYVGRVMQSGGLPYVDVFDHKGPLLYILNYLGLSLTGNVTGIWIEECLLLLICSVLFFGCIHKHFGQTSTIISMISFFMLIMGTSCGNMTESWGLCFTLLILADMTEGLLSRQWGCRRCFLSGFFICALALLRPNLLPIGFVYVIVAISDICSKRDYVALRRFIKCITFGACVLFFSIVCWMNFTGCFTKCFQEFIVFNIKYLGLDASTSKWNYIFLSLTLFFSGCVYFSVRSEKSNIRHMGIWCSVAALFNWGVIALKPTHEHYFVIMIPTIVFLIAMTCCYAGKVKYRTAIVTICFMFACCGFESICVILRPWVDLNLLASSLCDGKVLANASNIFAPACNRDHISDEILSLKPYIDDLNSVTVLHNDCFVYEVLGAKTPWRYPYQSPIAYISNEVSKDIESLIEKQASRYIVYPKSQSDWGGGAKY